MKKCVLFGFALLVFVAVCAMAYAKSGTPEGITRADTVAPSAFCKVVKEPNPALLGAWQCTFMRYIAKTSQTKPEPIQYYFGKFGDRYAIYFFRDKDAEGDRVIRGWREWTVNGDEITSDTGVRIFVENGGVYLIMFHDKPVKMAKMDL